MHVRASVRMEVCEVREIITGVYVCVSVRECVFKIGVCTLAYTMEVGREDGRY